MIYTLLNFLVWAVLFALLGGVVGWTLRSLTARREAARSRSDATVDAAGTEAVLGHPIRSDDLTVVDGIGPRIAELCAGIGVTTWSELGRTDVATLRTMLDDGGAGFKSRDPSTWPRQAELLAAGRWDEFRALTASASIDDEAP